MHSYLQDTEFATSQLIFLISNEEIELQLLREVFNKAEEDLKRLYLEFQASEFDIDDNVTDLQLQHAYGRFYSFGRDVVHPLRNQIAETQMSLDAKDLSIRELCGALLQIAKQGISTVYKGITNCPDGRLIGQEPLKNVIWQARNQSMHYEEGHYNKNVLACFENLQTNFGNDFILSDKNLSKEVIDLLGWGNYQQYEQDMISLLG